MGNYRVLSAGWPSDALRESGICIGYCEAPIERGFWVIGKYEQLLKVIETHNFPMYGEVEPVPVSKVLSYEE